MRKPGPNNSRITSSLWKRSRMRLTHRPVNALVLIALCLISTSGCGGVASQMQDRSMLGNAKNRLMSISVQNPRGATGEVIPVSYQEELPGQSAGTETLPAPVVDSAAGMPATVENDPSRPEGGAFQLQDRLGTSSNYLQKGSGIHAMNLRRRPKPASEIAMELRSENDQLARQLATREKEIARLQEILESTSTELKRSQEENQRLDRMLLTVRRQYGNLQEEYTELTEYIQQAEANRQKQIDELTSTIMRFEKLMNLSTENPSGEETPVPDATDIESSEPAQPPP